MICKVNAKFTGRVIPVHFCHEGERLEKARPIFSVSGRNEEVLASLSESPYYEVGFLGTVLIIIPANDESQAAPAVRDGAAALIFGNKAVC